GMLFKIQVLRHPGSRIQSGGIPLKDSNTGAACIYHPIDGEKPSLPV
ncbi:hypothetical protein A2U01_0085615, partial [Trifolium medium]|nr:hypothetical protein [Trifolium medium]